jgi:hypothetical protein
MYRKVISLLVVAGVCLAAGVAVGGTKAKNPDPADGALSVMTPLLKWTKGDTAIFHNVHLGTTAELTAANLVAPRQPFEMYYHIAGFQPGTTYYWRVDEIEGNGTVFAGDVWRFMTQALTAYYPTPADKASDVSPTPTLSWLPGVGATAHRLYFGDSLDAVTQGAAGVDKGTLAATTFAPGTLEGVKTYYWRVDETTPGGVKTGPVWSFTTFLSVDDFESYTDNEGSRIYQTWIDGTGPDPKTPGNGTGAVVGNPQAPFAEQRTVHGGKQAMPLDYNNVAAPFYSEAVRDFASVQDWTAGGVTTLTLYFRGTSANKPEKLYIAVQDKSGKVGVSTYPTVGQIALPAWTRWEIPLSAFSTAGVNLAAVKKMYLGVGDRASPKAGGAGKVYFDDIYVGGLGSPTTVATLFAEDFEGLVLGPKVDESQPGVKVWTKKAPPGWTIDDTGVPGAGTAQDGVTEWAGWSFADRLWWTAAAADQRRSEFTKGIGTVAIADPDEWDDAPRPAGRYNTYLSTPAIDISAAKAGTLELTFDSSWRPEFADYGEQSGNLKVSFDGGKAQELFLWLSDTSSPKFKPDATNETVKVKIDAPAGAKSMVLTFGLFNCGNNWWWAIDNILVTAAPK